ncbi:MAG: CYTH domain-containing protein [Candidatus Brocadiia bacterium]
MPHEMEAKLLVPDEATFEALRQIDHIGRLRAIPKGSRLQQDTYVDTASRRLLRAGYACRLRHTGHRAFAQLKGLGEVRGAIHRRHEMDEEIDNPSIGCLLRDRAGVGQVVRRIAQGERVRPLFTVVTRRHAWDAWAGPTRCLEMALDRSSFFGGEEELMVLEVELESLDGDRALLEQASWELRRRYRLAPTELTKFHRGLRCAGVAAGRVPT